MTVVKTILNKPAQLALSALGILAVGASVLPMLQTLRGTRAVYPVAQPSGLTFLLQSTEDRVKLDVDLQDNLSASDVAAFNKQYGIDLKDNSTATTGDNLMSETMTYGQLVNVLAEIKSDPRVEAAEEDITYRLPESEGITTTTKTSYDISARNINWNRDKNDNLTKLVATGNVKVKIYEDIDNQSTKIRTITSLDNVTLDIGDGETSYISSRETEAKNQNRKNNSDPEFIVINETQHFIVTSKKFSNLGNSPVSIFADSATVTTETAPSGSIMLPAGEKMYIRGPHKDKEITPRDDSDPNAAPNDPRYPEQWNFKMVGDQDAWKRTKGKGAIVAVIDTGVTVPGSKKGPIAEDLELTKFVAGYDFVNKDADAYDDHGHGTHVAGTIAQSTNNKIGVAGLAFESSIMPLKVLSKEGSGSSADIADAIRWAADHGAHVINMSLGSMYPSTVMEKACDYARKKNVTIVCAAGNGFGPPVGYPAGFKSCIAVSAVGPDGDIATYSSYGKQVALAAPGGDVLKSGNKADGILQSTVLEGKPGYYAFNGTSMASPHVAAAAALLVSQGVKDPAKIQDILQKTAVSKGNSADAKEKYGAGILNVGKATARAEGLDGTRMRHFIWPALAFLLLAIGGMRRSLGLRMAMAGAMGVGFFAPELFANSVGYDSAWNLLGFSAMAPALATALLWRGRGVKVAAAYALGTAFCLFAGYHNNNLPFTTHTFGATALPFVFTNIVAGFGLSIAGGLKALKRL
jgi:subtilisin family serine protease